MYLFFITILYKWMGFLIQLPSKLILFIISFFLNPIRAKKNIFKKNSKEFWFQISCLNLTGKTRVRILLFTQETLDYGYIDITIHNTAICFFFMHNIPIYLKSTTNEYIWNFFNLDIFRFSNLFFFYSRILILSFLQLCTKHINAIGY